MGASLPIVVLVIALSDLRFLSAQRKKDAGVLLLQRRYAGAVYLMGYAVELALKRKLCEVLEFLDGFPESDLELEQFYPAEMRLFKQTQTGFILNRVKQIKHHRLNGLLEFTGLSETIRQQYKGSRAVVETWNPSIRYTRRSWTASQARLFIAAAHTILDAIL